MQWEHANIHSWGSTGKLLHVREMNITLGVGFSAVVPSVDNAWCQNKRQIEVCALMERMFSPRNPQKQPLHGVRPFSAKHTKGDKHQLISQLVFFQAWVSISNRWDVRPQRRQRPPLTAQSFPGEKSSLSRRSEPALLSSGCPNRRWGQLWANSAQWDVELDRMFHKAVVIFFEDFALDPPWSLWELIKHWTAWGQAPAGE